MIHRKMFTKEEIKQACELYKNGYTFKKIGELLDRHPDSIREKLKKIGVYKPKYKNVTEKEAKLIIEDYKSGMTPKELSIKYAPRTDTTIISVLRRHGVYIEQTVRLTDEQWDEIAELYRQGDLDGIFGLYPKLKKGSLQSKMSKMNISFPRNIWSKEDLEIVEKYYYKKDINEIYAMIDGRHSIDSINTKALREFGYRKNDKFWTIEEDELFKEKYSIIPLDDFCKLFPNRTRNAIITHGMKLGVKSKDYIDVYWDDDSVSFLINNWKIMTDKELAKELNRDIRSIQTKRQSLELYRVNKNFNGYEDLLKLLRGHIWEWKQESMKVCDYKCVLTGSKDFQIHHLYNFGDIVSILFEKLNIKSKKIDDYSKKELDYICDEFVKLHNQYPLGVCIRKDIHQLYHKIYGKDNNTPKEWSVFVTNYNNGDYDLVA